MKMSGLISLSATKASNGLKVNVVNTSNINLTKNKTKSSVKYPKVETFRTEEDMVPRVYAAATEDETEVVQEETTVDYENAEKLTKMSNEIQALKLIIGILQDNPFYINKFVVADDTVLMEVIKLLTNADDIVMDAEDIGEGCVSKKKYRKVNAIYVVKDGETKNLKYSYPSIVQELTELHISFKFVW